MTPYTYTLTTPGFYGFPSSSVDWHCKCGAMCDGEKDKRKKEKKSYLSDGSRGCLTISRLLLVGNDGNVGGFDKLCL